MNIIKENLFFVVMGAVVLLALVLFVAVVQPLKTKNSDLDAKVEGLVKGLKDLVGRTTPKNVVLPNVAAMRWAHEYHDRYEAELKTMTDELANPNMRLSADLENLPAADRNQPGSFKVIYEKDIKDLKDKLAQKRITTAPESWHFWNWGEAMPSEETQRNLAAKEFSLSSLLIGVATNTELHVMQVDRVEVNPGETRTGEYHPLTTTGPMGATSEPVRVEPYFDVFPFILEVRMPVERYEILLRELLRLPVPVYVRQVSMGRIDDDPRVTRKIPSLYVTIRVEGWALDYNLQGGSKTGGVQGGIGGPRRIGG